MKTPSKSNNQFGIDCSFPGLCSYCHTEIAEFNGSKEAIPGSNVFRPVITGLKPNYRECMFVLDNGTKMTIALCDECDDDMEPQYVGTLMENEINGWQKEIDELCPNWNSDKKETHMEEHSKRFINGRSSRPWTLGQLQNLSKPRPEKLKIKIKKGKE